MALILAFRRWWAILFVALLSLPALGHFLPDLPAPMRTTLAPEARWWEEANKRLDPYVNNVFGFRGAVLAAHRAYVRFIGAPAGHNFIVGENGSLFYTGEHAMEQSVGQLVRADKVDEFVGVAERLKAQIAPWGGRLLVAVPPNSQTINFENLPAYARRQMVSPTEYDLLAARLKAAGVDFVDLRAVLREAKQSGAVYWRHDTHWNERGALIGFNAAMAAVGHSDFAVSPEEALGAPVARPDGDMMRMADRTKLGDPDLAFPMKGPMLMPDDLVPITGIMAPVGKGNPFPPFAFDTGHPGPRIMVLGDSFTNRFWRGLLAYRSSAFAWTHHLFCQFDRKEIDAFKPDILIYAATERLFPCSNELPSWLQGDKAGE